MGMVSILHNQIFAIMTPEKEENGERILQGNTDIEITGVMIAPDSPVKEGAVNVVQVLTMAGQLLLRNHWLGRCYHQLSRSVILTFTAAAELDNKLKIHLDCPVLKDLRDKCILEGINGEIWAEVSICQIQGDIHLARYVTDMKVCREGTLASDGEQDEYSPCCGLKVPQPPRTELLVKFDENTAYCQGVLDYPTRKLCRCNKVDKSKCICLFVGQLFLNIFVKEKQPVKVYDLEGLISLTQKMAEPEVRGNEVAMCTLDGFVTTCLSGFLTEQSDVFNAMISNDMIERTEQKITFGNMTNQGVKALVNYLCARKLDAAYADMAIAFELLHTSHQYMIDSLQHAMTEVFLSQPPEWFKLDLIVDVFSFTNKVPTLEGVMVKVIRICSIYLPKMDKIFECEPVSNERKEDLLNLKRCLEHVGQFYYT